MLRLGEVEVERARAPFEAEGRPYEAGALVVRMQQPASGFAKTLLERQRYPDLREYEGGPPKRPYDVTAHTLPLLLGVEVDAVASSFVADLEPVEAPGVPPGRVEGDAPRLALGHASGELVALGRLLEQGVKVRWALEPFVDAERSFAAGTLLVPASARRLVEPLASELGIRGAGGPRRAPRAAPPTAARGPLPLVGALDGRRLDALRLREGDGCGVPGAPRPRGAGGTPAGALRRHRPSRPGARLAAERPRARVDAGGVHGRPRAEGVAALRAFVEAGGTLVALDSATGFAIDQLGLPVRNALTGVEPAVFFCPGSILATRADAVHPLAHGLPETTPVWFEGSPAFEVDQGSVVLRYEAEDPLLSGWLLGGERLRGKAALAEVPLGKGRVVLFGFRPQYRAQSRVTYAALLNALYLSAAEP